jgi:DNA end-binding protein Ku
MAASPGRSIWNGTLAFGLVALPVQLYTATEDHNVHFNQVRRSDGAKIKYRRVAETDGLEVPFSEIAKGYEVGDEMVILDDNDLANLPLPAAKTMEVLQFVDPGEIDPMMFSKAYYVRPVKAATRPFALMTEAMRNTGLAGIVKLALRQRESLGLLQLNRDGALTLITLLWPDEVREAPKPDQVQLNPAMVTQAEQLVSAMSGTFEPEEYTDGYADAVKAMIAAKTSGTVLPVAETVAANTPVDLEDILKASVASAKARKITPKASKAGSKGKKAKA